MVLHMQYPYVDIHTAPYIYLCIVQHIWMVENALQRFSMIRKAFATFAMNARNFVKWWRMIFQCCSTPFFLRDNRSDLFTMRCTSTHAPWVKALRDDSRVQNINRHIVTRHQLALSIKWAPSSDGPK